MSGLTISKHDINELDYWGWECSECQHWNETQDNPDYEDSVCCEECQSEFLIEENQ